MASRRPSLTAHPFRPLLSALSLLSLLTGGCSMHMPLPGKLASEAETMPVREKKSLLTDRIHWVRFGPFLAERIRKHQAPSEWDGRLGRARLQSDADYRFLLRTGAEGDWTCSCRNHAERVDFFPDLGPIREIGYRISLECGLEPSSGGPA
ncbi:MAG: hypothetical protein JWP91_270, partial [Fibrobacteres bacterium]|nr:hypothetical protein [Fibrobacterota bacterium]